MTFSGSDRLTCPFSCHIPCPIAAIPKHGGGSGGVGCVALGAVPIAVTVGPVVFVLYGNVPGEIVLTSNRLTLDRASLIILSTLNLTSSSLSGTMVLSAGFPSPVGGAFCLSKSVIVASLSATGLVKN